MVKEFALNEYMTREELFEFLGLNEATYRKYLTDGILKPFKLSESAKKFYFKRDEVEALFKPYLKSKRIAIVNQKGGVGKTTLTYNTLITLANRGYKVLGVDLDPQSNLTKAFLGQDVEIERDRSALIIFEREKKDIREEYIISRARKNIDIIGANILLTGVETINSIDIWFKLKKYLDYISETYDFIIIDCPPSLGILVTNAFLAVEYVIIPMCPDFYSPLGTEQLTKKLKEMLEFNKFLKLLGIVINQKSHNNISLEIAQQLKERFGEMIFKTEITQNVKIKESPFFTKSVIEYDKSSQGAEDFRNFVEELIKKLKME